MTAYTPPLSLPPLTISLSLPLQGQRNSVTFLATTNHRSSTALSRRGRKKNAPEEQARRRHSGRVCVPADKALAPLAVSIRSQPPTRPRQDGGTQSTLGGATHFTRTRDGRPFTDHIYALPKRRTHGDRQPLGTCLGG